MVSCQVPDKKISSERLNAIKETGMRFITKIIVIVLLIPGSSCGSGDYRTGKRHLIPAKDLVPIFTDLYLTDGLLSYQPVKNIFNAKDSIINYIEVIEKHGYTKAQMDNTMKYYFIHNPRKLQKIYDQVLAKLTEIESEIEINTGTRPVYNLWNQKPTMTLPENGVHNPLFFSIPISDTGMYTFTFDCIIFGDDQSLNPRTLVYFWHTDSTQEGSKDYWDKTDLIRDGIRHSYTISKRLKDTAFTHISGYLHDCDPQSIRWEKHSAFSNMLLTKGKIE